MKIKIFLVVCVLLTIVNFGVIFSAFKKPGSSVLGIDQETVQNDIVFKTENYHSIYSKNSAEVHLSDYRAIVLDKYFAKYNSPLTGYGDMFVQSCMRYNAPKDCTLLPAIAYVETKLCTRGISYKQFNCWGWGGSNQNRVWFNSYSNAIDTITRSLVSRYGTSLRDPNRIRNTYCGDHCNNWGEAVKDAQNEINLIAKQNSFPALF